jgi:hypothetical protein
VAGRGRGTDAAELLSSCWRGARTAMANFGSLRLARGMGELLRRAMLERPHGTRASGAPPRPYRARACGRRVHAALPGTRAGGALPRPRGCLYAPCRCLEPGCAFVGSPSMLRDQPEGHSRLGHGQDHLRTRAQHQPAGAIPLFKTTAGTATIPPTQCYFCTL